MLGSDEMGLLCAGHTGLWRNGKCLLNTVPGVRRFISTPSSSSSASSPSRCSFASLTVLSQEAQEGRTQGRAPSRSCREFSDDEDMKQCHAPSDALRELLRRVTPHPPRRPVTSGSEPGGWSPPGQGTALASRDGPALCVCPSFPGTEPWPCLPAGGSGQWTDLGTLEGATQRRRTLCLKSERHRLVGFCPHLWRRRQEWEASLWWAPGSPMSRWVLGPGSSPSAGWSPGYS